MRWRLLAIAACLVTAACGGSNDRDEANARRAVLAFERQGPSGSDVYVLDANGKVSLVARGGGSPAWAPSGDRIAFTRTTDGTRTLEILELASGSTTTVVTADEIRGPTWSPESDRIAFGSATGISIVSLESGDIRGVDGVVAGVDDLAWSPTTDEIAYTAPLTSIAILRVRDGRIRKLTRGSFDTHPTWSPDGRLLAFSHSRLLDGPRIVRMRAAGSLTALTRGGADMAPSWSSDGDAIAFARYPAGSFTPAELDGSTREADIYALDVATGAIRSLVVGPTNDTNPTWRPPSS